MNEAVDRIIVERARLDAGFSNSFFASLTGHMLLVTRCHRGPHADAEGPAPRGGGRLRGGPAPRRRRIAPGQRAGGHEARTEAGARGPRAASRSPQGPQAAPGAGPSADALPEPDSRRRARKATPPPAAPKASGQSGTGAATPGLEFGPPGPGVPGGTDAGGDWYMAGVQQKIWILWNQQIKSEFTHPIGVTFTIMADGKVTDVKVTQPSGASLLDMAAQRAVLNAAPFGPLPREYGNNRKTIQAVFRPTQG